MKKFGILCLATGLFVGYAPIASGTFGSLLGVGLVWELRALSIPMMLVLTLILAVAGVWASQAATAYLGQEDSPRIVIDEIVGFMVTMLGMPVSPYWLVAGFILFRFFDIMKFPPANVIDARMKNGGGIMLDDLVAGIYGNIILHLMLKAEL